MGKANRRGFTVIELVVVIGMIAILSTVAVSAFSTMQRRGQANDAARQVASLVAKARVAGASGRSISAAAAPAPAPAPALPAAAAMGPTPVAAASLTLSLPGSNPAADRIAMTTVSVQSPTQLALRAIAIDGTTQVLEVIDLTTDASIPLTIQEPTGSTMRFRRNGMRVPGGPNAFTLIGPNGVNKRIAVNASGRVEIF